MNPPPSSPDPAARPESDVEKHQRLFGEWFAPEFETRGMRNTTMVKLLNSVGANGRYGSSDISGWKDGRKRPSEGGCAFLAAAWGLPEPLVLRKAGYDDLAALRETRRPDGDRVLATIRRLPQDEQREIEGELALVEELILIKVEKMLRASGEVQPEQQNRDAS